MHKRGLSALLSVVMTMSFLPALPASALENDEPFPYTLFAGSEENGAITINADNVCLNGSIVTNGSIETTATNFNVNGQRIEHAQQSMVYAFGKLDDAYFDSDTVLTYESDYTVEDVNISLNTPIVSTGNISLNGNINLNTQLKAEQDIFVSGGSCNANNATLISHHGDIYIESTNFGFAGLIYAPYGDIVIDSSSLNLNNVVVIGQTITIDAPNLNVNHNPSAANVIGTISEAPDDHHDGADNYFYAVGAYNAETSMIDIAWSGSDVPATVDVLTSTDGETYSVVTSVTDATTYAYPVGNDFVSTYFKVSYIDANGDIVESIPFQAIVTEDGITIDYPDSDGDGIADILEAILGTDPSKIDTDDDGLTDYQELNITGTDPTDYDSVEKRIADADADCDGDGVSNLEEIELGTDPQVLDSDDDGLADGEEVNTYLTDPLLEDTDGDGLTDGFEVRYGLDPLSPYTNGIADAEHKIEQTISADSPVLSEVNTSDSPYEMSVTITTNGDAERGLDVAESGYSVSLENDAQIGGITDLNLSDSCDPDSIRLTYVIKDAYRSNTLNKYSEFEDLQGIKRLCVFKYFDEISMMLPLDTQYDLENNTIYADVNDGGTYCVMDLEVWFDIFEVDPTDIADEIHNSDDSATAPNLRSPLRLSASSETAPEINSTPISIYILLQGAGQDEALYKKQVAAIEDFCSKIFIQFPISLIVLEEKHCSRSEELVPGSGYYNISTSYSTRLIDSSTLDDDGEIELNDEGYCTLRGDQFDDNSNFYSTLIYALSISDAQYKFVFDFQNGNLHVDDIYNILMICRNYNCCYSRFHSDEYLYETSIYDYNNQVHEAILDSNGIELTDIDEASIEMIELIKSTVPWTTTILLSNNLKKVQLKGLLSPTNGIDSDEDTLNDWDEADNRYITINADGSVSLPTIQNLLSHIDIEGILDYAGHEGAARNAMFNAIRNREVLPCKTDPSCEDSDNDGYTDFSDPSPMVTPMYLNGKYDFMDNEIYYLAFANNKRLNHSGSTMTVENRSDSEAQQFKFIWTDNGYKITTPDESLNLTLVPTTTGNFTSMMQIDKDSNDQKWEVLPYSNEPNSGFVLRSKMINKSAISDGESIYLSFHDGIISTVNTMSTNCIINIDSLTSNWNRFGELYMQQMEWIAHDSGIYTYDLTRAFQNYKSNSIVDQNETNEGYFDNSQNSPSVEVRLQQSGDRYKKMKYADATMNEVICEVMGTYNAMCIAKGTNKAADFLRLAVEFEMSGIRTVWLPEGPTNFVVEDINILVSILNGMIDTYVDWTDYCGWKIDIDNVTPINLTDSFFNDGGWGSWPKLIGNCLSAYQISYDVFPRVSDYGYYPQIQNYENALKDPSAKCGIMSYSFSAGLGLHTFAIDYNGVDIYSYNRNTGSTKAWYQPTITDILQDRTFYYGYVLY